MLQRDKYTCQGCGCSGPMQIHHIHYRSQGGTDQIENLITLCPKCHNKVHKGQMESPRATKDDNQQRTTALNTVMPEIYRQLQELCTVEINYGTDTKNKRNQLNIEKTHSNDALMCTVLNITSPKIINFKIDINLVSSRRHNRARTARTEDRKYYIAGTKKCIARNKKRRCGQKEEHISLEEFKKNNSDTQVIAAPGGRVYYTHKLTAPFNAGDLVQKDHVVYLVKSFSTTQRRIYTQSGFITQSGTRLIKTAGGIQIEQ